LRFQGHVFDIEYVRNGTVQDREIKRDTYRNSYYAISLPMTLSDPT